MQTAKLLYRRLDSALGPVRVRKSPAKMVEALFEDVFTHVHDDHLGWNVAEGTTTPLFANASYVVHRADWGLMRDAQDEEDREIFAAVLAPLEAAGRLELSGRSLAVNIDGEIFVAAHAGPLPQFRGPDHFAGEIASRYAEWTRVLAPLGFGIAELAVSARGAWHVRADGPQGPLSLELGRDDPTGRLSRFVAAYGRTIGALARQGTRVDHVDLRYRNGFAARVPGLREAPAKSGA